MNQTKEKKLKKIAKNIRLGILEEVHAASSGHPGGSLSIADILAYLYWEEMNVRPDEPDWADRDRLVLSKGHTAPAIYAALAEKGYLPKEDLKGFRQIDSYLQGHPDMKHTPGVDMTTGSLGLGVSASDGMALSAKVAKKEYRVYAIVGDGESEEGQVWEAAMFAAHYKLDNLCWILDLNGLQIDGKITDVIDPTPHDKKFEAFGWNVLRADAHDFASLEAAFKAAKKCKGKPSVIIADSIKGKGVSFMENQVGWHGKAPNDEQYAAAVAELNAAE
ncbi:MAG: transketolase [Clostridia bacterium]|jgi:transketolase|nr:transketolase [Clostridia bacterium]